MFGLRNALPFALILASGCTLLTQFDPNSQPCDSAGECLPGFTCVNNVCKGGDAGTSFDGGGGGGGGTDGGGGRETNCADGLDDDNDGARDCADSDCAAQACNDNDPCTVGDVCMGTTCQRGTPKVCNTPPSPCQATNGTCEAGTGRCLHAPLSDGTSCGSRPADRCCGGTCVNTTLVTSNCGGCGLACAGGQLCQSINQSSCMMEPVDTSGRCSCGTGAACPMGQTCGTSGFCVPTSAANCATGQTMAMNPGCQTYCRY
ncbi:MAG: hypothetical protein JNM17_26365 [Archangium sp.]|nr:hypothetical protein [Archangium sp.]